MTAKISHAKATKILHHYFRGMPQLKIAQKCNVNQATVSRYAIKFEKEVVAKGIVEAAKEYGIMEEVTALRSLAIELQKSKASVEEAKSGLKMVKLFDGLGVPPEEHKALARAVSKIKEPAYIKATMNLAKLEESTGKSYTDALNVFKQLGDEITKRQEAIATLKEKQENEDKAFQELKLAREKKEAEVMEFEKEAEQKKAKIDADLAQKLAVAELTQEKIAELQPVAEKMKKFGISDAKLETFVGEHQVLEEHGITWEKFNTVAKALAKAGEIDEDGLATRLTEYGSLEQAIKADQAEKTSLQPAVEQLGKEKAQLATEVNGLSKKTLQLETEVGHSEELKKALDETIDTLKAQRTHLEKYLAGLQSDVAELQTKKAALADAVSDKEKKVLEMDEKLKTIDAIDQVLKGKKTAVKELEVKVAAAEQKFQLFEAFLGLLGRRNEAEIEEFLKLVPALVDAAKAGKYDPAFLVNTVLGQLCGGTLDLLVCQYCGAEFVMLKRVQKAMHSVQLLGKLHMWCPDCGVLVKVVVKTPLAVTLKKVIVSGKPTLKKPGETATEKDNQSENQASL